MKKLSDLRAYLVHDIKQVDIKLAEHFNNLEPDKKNEWKQALGWSYAIEPGGGRYADRLKQWVMQVPRFGIFNATLEVMTQASIQIAESGAQQRADDLLRQLGQKMRDQQLKDKQQQSSPSQE